MRRFGTPGRTRPRQPGALVLADLQAEARAEHVALDAKVLAHVPAHPAHIFPTTLAELVNSGKSGPKKGKIDEALARLLEDGKVIVNKKGPCGRHLKTRGRWGTQGGV